MNLTLRIFSFLIAVMVCPLMVMAKAPNDTIVAIVNNEAITLKDLRDYIGGIYRQLRVENKTQEEISEVMATYEEKGIKQLVEDKLILAAAELKGLQIRPEVIKKRLKEIKERYKNEDDFIASLTGQGMTITDLRNKITNQLKARYLVDIEVKQKVFVNPQDVTAYYQQHQNDFDRKARYNLQSIYISFNKGKEEAQKKILEAKQRLEAGEDFDKLLKEYSELPSVGNVEQGQMVPAIEDVIFALKLEQISTPVEVEGGVYVFKAVGISPGRMAKLSEVKDEIYNKLYDQIFQKKFEDWVAKLRAKAYVEIRG